jgi:hypothetical protein
MDASEMCVAVEILKEFKIGLEGEYGKILPLDEKCL